MGLMSTKIISFVAILTLFLSSTPLAYAQDMSGMDHGNSVQEMMNMDHSAMPQMEGIDVSDVELCDSRNPSSWRDAQTIEGVDIAEDPSCDPDMPALIAASVKGTNNVSAETLNATGLAPDAVVKGRDLDGDGDPDEITINLEIWGLNEGENPLTTYEIAPGITPAFWAFAPKGTGMVTEGMSGAYLVRMPSPTIRVEQGDKVKIVVANTHYLPHTVHLHGVDHPFVDENGEGNDGVPHASEVAIMPGESRTYDIQPRTTGSMAYHCHVQPQVHVQMGLNGLFVVEENRPNNFVQTLNVGAGFVRHQSVASAEEFTGEYDILYQDADKELHGALNGSDDPREIAKFTTQEYDVTERKADYFILNGRSFPYTLRESQIIVEPNEEYRLRILNMGNEAVALHTHGHKMFVKSLDGVDLSPGAQYYRDVISIDTAQRVDVVLNTTDDGLNSYGEGIWMFHDHHESAVTTDGIAPGGDMSFIVYKSWLGEDGFPDLRLTSDIRPFFTKEFYQKKVPVWIAYDPMNLFGKMLGTDAITEDKGELVNKLLIVVLVGVVLGGLLGLVVSRRKQETRNDAGFVSVIGSVYITLVLVALLFIGMSFPAFAQVAGMDGIHIMPNGDVMLGTGEVVETATINANGMIVWEDGTIITPVLDMRSEADKEAYAVSLQQTVEQEQPETVVPEPTADMPAMDMSSSYESDEHSHLGMEGIEGIHIMPNGRVMTGNGMLLNDVSITADGMIILGSGEEVQPILDMRNGDGIRRTSYSAVVNENFDRLPLGCSELAGETEITVKAGVEFASEYPGTMFTYDEHSFEDIPPCTRVTVTFENMDSVRHQFMVHDLPPETYPMGMFNIEVTGPATETGTFITPPEDATLFVHCGVPEHEAKGMVAQIKVGNGDGDVEGMPGRVKGNATTNFIDPVYFYGLAGALGSFLFVLALQRKRTLYR